MAAESETEYIDNQETTGNNYILLVVILCGIIIIGIGGVIYIKKLQADDDE